jgi:GR25 family glycosyltransferase involved in LPS biosynthesis
MNDATYPGLISRWLYRMMLNTRYLGGKQVCQSFGTAQETNTIQRIYVINLDRQRDRWLRMVQELNNLVEVSKTPLTAIARRFSAVDARYYKDVPDNKELLVYYSLADQLFVEPNPLLERFENIKSHQIEMTRPEIAIALSHIAVWKLIAVSDRPYTLVLEDDVYFRHGFARMLDRAWVELLQSHKLFPAFDMLYLSYKEARTEAPKIYISENVFKPVRGLWQLSGYVLSAQGAKKLIDMLPVRGPVDLWINHQFKELDVFATQRSIIEQRFDSRSGNAYSILPVLSKFGAVINEKPLVHRVRTLPKPIFAFGKQGSGLTSLAIALSMLGYRCCSDIDELPMTERANLFGKKKERIFDAYVNVGSLTLQDYIRLAKIYRQVHFIITEEDKEAALSEQNTAGSKKTLNNKLSSIDENDLGSIPKQVDEFRKTVRNILVLPAQHADKWELLCKFLECDYPSDQFPECKDKHQQKLAVREDEIRHTFSFTSNPWKSDTSPWVASFKDWHGILIANVTTPSRKRSDESKLLVHLKDLDFTHWVLRDDTFPSNLSIFCPRNCFIGTDGIARLMLREEHTPVRDYTSAAICSKQFYHYGRFIAEIRPAKVSGLITGVFLHRNSPRQEIDIEFLGKDTTKMLINVYYNPGIEGARMEYGYRGTPTLIDLGFDASKDYHRYEIEWYDNIIRWYVDEQLAFERVSWNPTPIPHLPMQFNINLWYSRSEGLAGKLHTSELPAQTELRIIEVDANSATLTNSDR